MKATKNKIIDYLQWTSKELEKKQFQVYWNWCRQHGGTDSIVQQMLANSSINKWYLIELNKLELQFITIAELNPNAKNLESMYYSCISQIFTIYPKALVNEIKRNTSFSEKLITNTPIYYAN